MREIHIAERSGYVGDVHRWTVDSGELLKSYIQLAEIDDARTTCIDASEFDNRCLSPV